MSHETRARALPPPVQRRPSRAMAPLAAATRAGARQLWYDSHLRYAADAYRAVLVGDPNHAEALVRLARVQLERGLPADALATLVSLVTSPCNDTTCALGWLTRGEAHEALGEFDAARDAYRRASAVAAIRPTAMVALRAVDANSEEAGDATATFVPTDEPTAWRNYLLGVTAAHLHLLAALREAV